VLLFLTSPENMPFILALFILLLIAVSEIISICFGFSLSQLLGHNLPDSLQNSHSADFDSSHTVFETVLGWLRMGEMPLLILFIIFLSLSTYFCHSLMTITVCMLLYCYDTP